jgi:hypothetical protein
MGPEDLTEAKLRLIVIAERELLVKGRAKPFVDEH